MLLKNILIQELVFPCSTVKICIYIQWDINLYCLDCYVIDNSHFEYTEVQGCGWKDDSRPDKTRKLYQLYTTARQSECKYKQTY